MNVYTTDKIRNVVLLGHGGAGKTSLVEAMAYLSGITNRMGKSVMEILSVIMIKKRSRESFQSAHPSFQLNGDSGRSIFLIRRVISILLVKLKKHYPLQTARSSLFPVKLV